MSTLYEDWQARRARMKTHEWAWAWVDQARVLDFLLKHYANDPAAQQPARATMLTPLVLDSRAIVVHHHLGRGVYNATRSEGEARTRANRILKRIADVNPQEVAGAPGNRVTILAAESKSIDIQGSLAVGRLLQAVKWQKPDSVIDACEILLRSTRTLPEYAVEFLCQPSHVHTFFIERIFPLFEKCDNSSALNYLINKVLSWDSKYFESDRKRIEDHIVDKKVQSAELLRAALMRAEPKERCAAALLLARIGELNDIGLFEDLLAVPEVRQCDEERRCYIAAMERIAGMHAPLAAPGEY